MTRRTHLHGSMGGLATRPEHYERLGARVAGRLYRRVVSDVATAGLPSGSLVLDVGTGPGRVPRLIAESHPDLRVRGVDLSPEMIDYAVTKALTQATIHDPARLDYEVADVADLPFDDASFDLVVSSISFHHWADPAAGLREVVRVLKPGASAWIYDFRWVLRRHPAVPAACVTLQTRSWFSPIGRLILTRPTDPQ